jgi:hypothetical protein
MNKNYSNILRHCVLSAVAAFAAMSALADAITWEGSTNLAMTAATTVEVPAGRTNVIEELSGAYALTKTGGGTLEIRYVKTATASVVVSEGLVRFANPRPDDLFARAYFHVDASDLSSMVIETVNGTNFVTRWNDVDGRADRYATHCTSVWSCRKNPENRKPFLRMDFQNGLPVMDFGTLLTQGSTNSLGEALGYGAAMKFDKTSPFVKEGFTVASDTEDYVDWKWDGAGMSFFSHETSWRFVRCAVSPTSATCRGILNDNRQNNEYFEQGKSIWFDGNLITGNPKWTVPSIAFHIYRIRPSADGGTTFNSFAAEYYNSTRSYGGQRIAEYILFTNATETGESTMTDIEASALNRYLRVKWFAQSVSRVSVADGASLDVDPSANLTILSFGGEGSAADLAIAGGSSYRVPFFNTRLHLDASRADTMTIVPQNGTNFVTRWNDADGGSVYAYHDDSEYDFRDSPTNRMPFISTTTTLNSLPVMDFGPVLFAKNVDENGHSLGGYGAAMRFTSRLTTLREAFTVVSDTEDLKEYASSYTYGPSFVSDVGTRYPAGENSPCNRGQTVNGKNPKWFYTSTTGLTAWLDGVSYTSQAIKNSTFPDGFHIVSFTTTTSFGANALARTLRSTYGANAWGGQRIAEYMLFDTALPEAKRERIYKALRTKWFGDPPVTTNFYGKLSLGEGATLTVGYDEFLAVTNKLTIAGTLSATSVSAANMAIAGADATVNGALTLADGATLSFTRHPDGTWTSLSATSVEAEGAVTVSLSGNLKGLAGTSARLIATDNPPASLNGWATDFVSTSTQARLVLKADGVWIEFLSPGLVILVK